MSNFVIAPECLAKGPTTLVLKEKKGHVTVSNHSSDGNDDEAAASAIQNCWRERRKRDIAKEAALKTAKALTTKRESGVLPKSVTDLIEEIEDKGERIEKMEVIRTPVQEYVGHLMQIISIGKYKDAIAESPYDRMFHLSVLINERYVLQKNEVIALSDAGSSIITEESETMPVHVPDDTPLTLTQLLDRTKEAMGPESFSNYCAVSNNCQDFILAVLRSNGLASPDLVSFIKQDAEGIFNQLPIHTKPVAKALTDVAAIGNRLAEDITIKHQETDYSALLDSAKDKLPPERVEGAHKLMEELKITKSEAEEILKGEGRKRDKIFGLVKGKLKKEG